MCKYEDICWRFAYTKMFIDCPERRKEPPTRKVVMLEGYASLSIYPNGGISSKTLDDCPNVETCPDLIRHEKRQRAKKAFFEKRPAVPKDIRRNIASKFSYTCVYCGVNINRINPHTGERFGGVIDHRIPIALGGKTTEDNLVLACRKCNSDKSDNLWEIGCRYGKENQ